MILYLLLTAAMLFLVGRWLAKEIYRPFEEVNSEEQAWRRFAAREGSLTVSSNYLQGDINDSSSETRSAEGNGVADS